MSLTDLYRSEHSEFVVGAPVDAVMRAFVDGSRGGRQVWSGGRLRLARERTAGLGPGHRSGSVGVVTGPWLEVRASAEPGPRTRITCRIGPIETDWFAAFLLSALTVVAAGGLALGALVLLQGTSLSDVPLPAVWVIGWVVCTAVALVSTASASRRRRRWCHDVLTDVSGVLGGHPSRSTAAAFRSAGIPVPGTWGVQPPPPVVGPQPLSHWVLPDLPPLPWWRRSERRLHSSEPPHIVRERLLTTPPFHVVEDGRGGLVVTASEVTSSPPATRTRSMTTGRVHLSATPDGGTDLVSEVVPPVRLLLRAAVTLPLTMAFFRLMDPIPIWTIAAVPAFMILVLGAQIPASARRLDRAFVASGLAVGARPAGTYTPQPYQRGGTTS